MTYGYRARIAWLDDLDPEHAPSGYDLCRDHADAFRVPQGWERADRRVAGTLFSGFRSDRSSGDRSSGDRSSGDRSSGDRSSGGGTSRHRVASGGSSSAG